MTEDEASNPPLDFHLLFRLFQLNFIMACDAAGDMQLWACRGEGKGCGRNRFRTRRAPCGDCLGPLPDGTTLAQVQELLRKGDA